ncbi:hypothetical protein B0O80DRAFT_493252 [Mortierella sp. GBAus27b]|nr:hypothetical protein B0O80DRAFT_493252 [Mortierella sp. GBAus27b]
MSTPGLSLPRPVCGPSLVQGGPYHHAAGIALAVADSPFSDCQAGGLETSLLCGSSVARNRPQDTWSNKPYPWFLRFPSRSTWSLLVATNLTPPTSTHLLLFSSKYPASPESSSTLSTDAEPVELGVPTLPEDTVETSYDTSQTLADSGDSAGRRHPPTLATTAYIGSSLLFLYRSYSPTLDDEFNPSRLISPGSNEVWNWLP